MPARVLIGDHPDRNEVGMWISKVGKDARTSTSEADFLFSPALAAARPFARFTSAIFIRGTFVGTSTNGGMNYDFYRWTAHFYHNFGFVPLVTTQYAAEIESPWVDAAHVHVETAPMAAFSYTPGDPNKTPVVIQNYQNGSPWGYDVPTQTMRYIKGTTVFTVYRNRIQ